jgi:hypothetical protein
VDPRTREAVEVAELHAEGRTGQEQLMAAWGPAWAAANEAHEAALQAETTSEVAPWDLAFAAEAAGNALAGQPLAAVRATLTAVHNTEGGAGKRLSEEERRRQASLLRDLLGPIPFRLVEIDPSWRTPAVVALANAIYDDRCWDDLPILGDALSEAGCTDAEVLEHCREKIHARGCWLTDLLLNKE